jgi:4-amino-4-deoxychorismate lyase
MSGFYINGKKCNESESDQCISFMDRAFQYGDGLFETIRVVNGRLPFFEYHRKRLMQGGKVLNLMVESIWNDFNHSLQQLIKPGDNGVLKLIVSRGVSPRGYYCASDIIPNWYVHLSTQSNYSSLFTSCHYLKDYPVKLCTHQLSRQPVLAGIKHLNRLDQILARQEWQQEYKEGIVLNQEGFVIEGTMSNIFWFKGENLYTPDLSLDGVKGVIRSWIMTLTNTLPCDQITTTFSLFDELIDADEIFMTNSVIGIQPVTLIQAKNIEYRYPIGKKTQFVASLFKQYVNYYVQKIN